MSLLGPFLALAAFHACAAADLIGVPDIGKFVTDWIPYRRGLGHEANDTAPLHGIALPIAQNVFGSVMADENVLAIRSLTVPPYSQGPYSTVARDVSQLGRLLVNSEALYTSEFQWTPWGFRRRGASSSGVSATTEVAMPLNSTGVVMRAKVHGVAHVQVELFAAVRRYGTETVNCTDLQWRFPSNEQQICWNWYAPRPFVNQTGAFSAVLDAERNLIVFHDADSQAVTVVALSTKPLQYVMPDAPGKPILVSFASHKSSLSEDSIVTTVGIAVVVGDVAELDALSNQALSWARQVDIQIDVVARGDRQKRFLAAFTPGNGYFSGSLPKLSMSSNEEHAIARHYYSSVLQTLDLERHALPFAPKKTKRVWITGAGENTSTNNFIWEADFSTTALAMLDPDTFREVLLDWLRPEIGGNDTRAGWGVDYMTGHSVGAWYAANDFTLFEMCYYYVAITGDRAFLRETVANRSVEQWMLQFSLSWQNLTHAGALGLADYGGAHALLECVPSYIHEVAGFNAPNVWMMEAMAKLKKDDGDEVAAAHLNKLAAGLAKEVLSLYVEGEGVWHARYPNGTKEVVRHVTDLVYVSKFMSRHLTDKMQKEMAAFAKKELITEHWMRALSLRDKFANFSDRADHGPNGAYGGWVPLTMAALARAGDWSAANGLLDSSASVISQGPYGQAICVTPADSTLLHDYPVVPYKPFEFTLWNELSGLSFADIIITIFFGLDTMNAALQDTTKPPVFQPTVPRELTTQTAVRLQNVSWQSKLWTATLEPGKGPSWVAQHDLVDFPLIV